MVDINLINKKRKSLTASGKQDKITHIGTGMVGVADVFVQKNTKQMPVILTDYDESLHVEVLFTAHEVVKSPVYGITIKDEVGSVIFASNTLWASQRSNDLKRDEKQSVTWQVPNIFLNGDYTITPAVASYDAKEIYDQANDMATFSVKRKTITTAIVNPTHEILIKNPESK